MKIELKYNDGILNLPRKALDAIDRATREDLAVLICLIAVPEAHCAYETEIENTAKKLSLSVDDVKQSLAFWRGMGVIDVIGTLPKMREERRLLLPDEIPNYTAAQIEDFAKKNPETKSLFDACQQTLERVFNAAEFNIIIGLRDYYGFEPNYILLLLSYCKEKGNGGLRYIEKMAKSLYDDGVLAYSELETYIRKKAEAASLVGQLRTMFGIGDRELTESEKKHFTTWAEEWCFPLDVIRMAFEIGADRNVKQLVPYVDRILKNWNENGLKTPEDVRAKEERYKKSKQTQDGQPIGFDPDDFFNAALKRSYDPKN